MAIIAYTRSPNFAHGCYHRIDRVELVCGVEEGTPHYVLHMAFYHNVWTRKDGLKPLYISTLKIPFSSLAIDPRGVIYSSIIASAAFAGLNPVSDEIN